MVGDKKARRKCGKCRRGGTVSNETSGREGTKKEQREERKEGVFSIAAEEKEEKEKEKEEELQAAGWRHTKWN